MSDPLTRFMARAEEHEVAGYFEGSPPARGGDRWAVHFVDPDTVLRFDPGVGGDTVGREMREILGRNPRGALVGYFGFEAVELFEPLLRRPPRGAPFPLGEFALVPTVRRERVPNARRGPSAPRQHPSSLPAPLDDSLPRKRFEAKVNRLRTAIRDGEAFQVVLAHRRTWRRPEDLFARVLRLYETERFQFFYLLKFGDRLIAGGTPESVVEVEGRHGYVNPIAGTRPRGVADGSRRRLTDDEKELAEHRMLVDLARNDLGRIATSGSVRLLWRERTERFSRLEHLVSRVTARLRPDVTAIDALAATFPAGTVSGAPKIRATELLWREEATWRGPYAGTVGVVGGNGDATWALTIRSAFAEGTNLYTAAGGGVVFPSEPAREFDETLTKLAQVEATLVGENA
ncbi:MAG: anthranilate synthase component I family protein [Thermoplasmata archaeon]